MKSETLKKKGILVADDDLAILKLISAVVEGEGYRVIQARDGKEAYRELRRDGSIVAAIVDVMMPYIEGTELVRFMRSDERFSKIPVIMMTADNNPKTNSLSFNAGAAAFITKPFSNSQLRTMIRTFVPQPEVADGA